MRALGAGSISSALAHRYIAMLDSLRRSYDAVETEERLFVYEQTHKWVEASMEGSARDKSPDSAHEEEPEGEDTP
jgi:hypothetical protein